MAFLCWGSESKGPLYLLADKTHSSDSTLCQLLTIRGNSQFLLKVIICKLLHNKVSSNLMACWEPLSMNCGVKVCIISINSFKIKVRHKNVQCIYVYNTQQATHYF